MRLGLGHFATGLGDGDRLLAVGVVQGSLQASGSGLQGRVQVALPPSLELVLALGCRQGRTKQTSLKDPSIVP